MHKIPTQMAIESFMINSFVREFAFFYLNKKQELEALNTNPLLQLGFLIKLVFIFQRLEFHFC